MSKTHNVAVIVGSLRKASINRMLAETLVALAPDSLQLKIVEIGDLPLYNEDIDVEPYPAAYLRFREQLKEADALLFVTPEYNRSIPAPMKNAIDVGSRPYGKSHFGGKPGAVLSASPGAIGGFGANHHLRQSMVFLDVYMLQQPESYLGGAGSFFDDSGNPSDSIKGFLEKFIGAYAAWVAKHLD